MKKQTRNEQSTMSILYQKYVHFLFFSILSLYENSDEGTHDLIFIIYGMYFQEQKHVC